MALKTITASADIVGDPERDEEIAKYWHQRYLLFKDYDNGIIIDRVGWYSVTPEPIAEHVARRMAAVLGQDAVVVDAMAGVGGSAIQLARYFKFVYAVELSPERSQIAKHNARVYGVDHRIKFITGDFLRVSRGLNADAVYLSPPWGGPQYRDASSFDLNSITPNGFSCFCAAQSISRNIAYCLPFNLLEEQMSTLAMWNGDQTMEIETNELNGRVKGMTVYFGRLHNPSEEVPLETSHVSPLPRIDFEPGLLLPAAQGEVGKQELN